MAVKLVAKTGFHAFGKDYAQGSVVDQADAEKWPEGTLATRLNNGSLEYKEGSADDEKGPDGEETNYETIQRKDTEEKRKGMDKKEADKNQPLAPGGPVGGQAGMVKAPVKTGDV